MIIKNQHLWHYLNLLGLLCYKNSRLYCHFVGQVDRMCDLCVAVSSMLSWVCSPGSCSIRNGRKRRSYSKRTRNVCVKKWTRSGRMRKPRNSTRLPLYVVVVVVARHRHHYEGHLAHETSCYGYCVQCSIIPWLLDTQIGHHNKYLPVNLVNSELIFLSLRTAKTVKTSSVCCTKILYLDSCWRLVS